MKNLSLVLNAVLLVAVAALFIIVLSDGSEKKEEANQQTTKEEVQDYPIAYINTDSLLINYEYARFLNEELLTEEESSRADFNERLRVFQDDMRSFQRKVQNNGFLSLERAQNEERRLREKEQELQELNNQMSNNLMRQQNQMNRELRDTITGFLEEYTKKHPYKLVLSNTMGDNILFANKALNITDTVVEQLNKRYESSKEEK
ncbi:OmpH family outer membrane protein [Marinilabilia salmonicolor]|jgi:outer membrane protein|uniref:Periplasmic chaperone for outer membrane proteins Skp n=1 Tax=Marinilabilia salmonicolor TaxID=989 RepID=A0A2T0XNN7_9BACT|nr:OmpH family outer membrane protein [Marinilabilia salmonicolor]PRZ00492.1 periplasmic chaperone for outer membrane proteins Skp [Marinilabilia salmonicolor]RCW32703.1 periplasmic chaperone for outer membrane proteins Skp [Marinilabilia salmonicolor]